ncbi:sodium-independent anion transporter [Leadbetterella byssophila]|uniref:sodium-independent anion transporter n=1 Tax=Leadbetterella byssophila TaxID=316068 RepID=UPI00286E51F4|nr:sodium-independent anion transporter [Leadbetterella byssophila]
MYGPLFFGSTTAFLEKLEPEEDPKVIVLDFRESRIVDMSAIEALKKIVEKYENAGKSLTLRHLSSKSIVLLEQAKGFLNIPIEKGS